MKTIRELKKLQQEKVSALIEELEIVFAFSNEQFASNRREGYEYVSAGMGMLIPKQNLKSFHEKFDRFNADMSLEYQQNVSMDEYIAYELSNHEAYYTGDISDTFENVQAYYPNCTEEDVRRVYNKHQGYE